MIDCQNLISICVYSDDIFTSGIPPGFSGGNAAIPENAPAAHEKALLHILAAPRALLRRQPQPFPLLRFNYEERGQKTLLVKPRLDQRDGDHMVHSRIGLEYPCIYFDEMLALSAEALQENACIIVDEAQFLSKEEVDYLVHIVDDLGVPVICYGLRADFKGELFPGSYELLVMADKLEEVKTICWCGKKAMFNARFDENGRVLKEGAQVVLGANDKYIGLCRRHWRAGDLGPDFNGKGTGD